MENKAPVVGAKSFLNLEEIKKLIVYKQIKIILLTRHHEQLFGKLLHLQVMKLQVLGQISCNAET